MAAAGALLKLLLALGHGRFQGLIVGSATHGPLNLISRILYPAQPAKQAASRIEQAAGNANGVRLEPRHVAVPAPVAVKFELEALVGG